MGFWVGTFLKYNENARKFVEKAVSAAYVTVAPPSESMRTIYAKNLQAKMSRKKHRKICPIAE